MRRIARAVPFVCALSAFVLIMVDAGAAGRETVRRVRCPVDTLGYATTPAQVEAVVGFADSIESALYASNAVKRSKLSGDGMIGAICPHDDYLYAGHVYVHAIREIEAPLVILFGVSHTARRRKIQDVLIFDSHTAWVGPYGECPVSPMRESVTARLPEEMVLVSDEIHAEEHSLEAFIPFLQYYDRPGRGGGAPSREREGYGGRTDAEGGGGNEGEPAGRKRSRALEILPILVTRINRDAYTEAVHSLAAALFEEIRSRGWRLGRDVFVLISADCVHYGDDKWGGRNYAPFGTGKEGHARGVDQDLDIISSSLTGTLSVERIARFSEKVERDDFQWPYKVTWCGVYSIPFGLRVLLRMTELTGRDAPEGVMLRYATSIDREKLPLEYTGLGVTNINTPRHWVGYAAIGYW
jgi:predicted class III extradiol MEMO1 family dioxygenase